MRSILKILLIKKNGLLVQQIILQYNTKDYIKQGKCEEIRGIVSNLSFSLPFQQVRLLLASSPASVCRRTGNPPSPHGEPHHPSVTSCCSRHCPNPLTLPRFATPAPSKCRCCRPPLPAILPAVGVLAASAASGRRNGRLQLADGAPAPSASLCKAALKRI